MAVPSPIGWERARVRAIVKSTQIISLVKKNAYLGEKGLDSISPVW
jgi:hypothetical protein